MFLISNFLFKSILTLSSTSLISTIFFIKKEYIFYCLDEFPQYFSYFVILLLPLVLTRLSLCLHVFLANACIEHTPLAVEDAANSFLPSYLGYFFVALSVNSNETFWYVFGILFIFTYLSQTIYFNPIFLIFGYNFYYVTTINNKKIFVITKKKLDAPTDLLDIPLKRINNFTFIEVAKKNSK